MKKRQGPFFTVIVPVYNKGPHIKRSLQSILCQTYKSFELIVICDPSTDHSNSEVAKFADERIRVFHRSEPGPGGYAARNLGILNSRASWITFLDADDEWNECHLERLHRLAFEHPNALVLASGWITKEGNTESVDRYTQQAEEQSTFLTFHEYLQNEVAGRRPICTSAACIRKDILLKAGMFPSNKITMGGDLDTWVRCIYLARGMARHNGLGAIYHRDSINMVTKSSYITTELHRTTTEGLISNIEDRNTIELLRKRYNRIIIIAWVNNMYAKPHKKNISLIRQLDFKVNPIKLRFYVAFSLLPRFLAIPLHRTILTTKRLFRNQHKGLRCI